MSRLDESQGRGDFFKSLGTLFGGFLAEQVETVVEKVTPRQLRPPGALDEFAFLTACTRCENCIEACPQDSLIKAGASAGLGLHAPYLDPRAMPCFLCTDLPCVKACPDGALVWPRRTTKDGEELDGPAAVKIGTAVVKPSLCLTWPGEDRAPQDCQVCVDRCPYPGVAIRMLDGHPDVVEDRCTGCGLCVFGCPTAEPAIVVRPDR